MIQKHTIDYNWNLEDKLCTGLKAIYSILTYNITQLYDPPFIDHVLISYVFKTVYLFKSTYLMFIYVTGT